MVLPINRKNKPMKIQPICFIYRGVTFSGVLVYVALNMVVRPTSIITIIIVNVFQSNSAIVLLFSISYIFLNNLSGYRSRSASAMTAMFYKHRYCYFRFIHRCECCKPCMIIESARVSLKLSSYSLRSSCLSGDLDKTAPCCPACPSGVVYDTLQSFLNKTQSIFIDACLAYLNGGELVDTFSGDAASSQGIVSDLNRGKLED